MPLASTEQFLKLSASIRNDAIYLYAYSSSDKIAQVSADDTEAVSSLSGTSGISSFTLAKGETVFIKAETDNYYKIAASDGSLGYLLKSALTTTDVNLAAYDFYAPKQQKYVRGTEKSIWSGNTSMRLRRRRRRIKRRDRHSGADLVRPDRRRRRRSRKQW